MFNQTRRRPEEIKPDLHWHGFIGSLLATRPDYSELFLTRREAIATLARVANLSLNEQNSLEDKQICLLGGTNAVAHMECANPVCLEVEHKQSLLHLGSAEITRDFALAGCGYCRKLVADETP